MLINILKQPVIKMEILLKNITDLLRILLLMGLWMRFIILKDQSTIIYHKFWLIALIVASFYVLIIIYIEIKKIINKYIKRLIIISDTIVISFFYLLTLKPNSDIYLFYILPFMLISEYLNNKRVITYFGFIGLIYVSCAIILTFIHPSERLIIIDIISNILPRFLFFFFVTIVLLVREELLRKQANDLIANRKQLQEQANSLKAKNDELLAIQLTIQKIINYEDRVTRLKAIMEVATKLLKSTVCEVYFYESTKDILKLSCVKGIQPTVYTKKNELENHDGLLWDSFYRNKIFYINNYKDYQFANEKLKPFVNSMISAPLMFKHKPYGVIALYDGEKKYDRKSEIEIYRLAKYISVAIHDIILIEEEKTRLNQIRALIDNIDDVIYVKDPSGRFLMANKSQVKLLGANSEEEIIGKSDYNFYDEEQAEKFRKVEMDILFMDKSPITVKETASINNIEKILLTTKVAYKNSKGVIEGIVGIGRDITQLAGELYKLEHGGGRHINKLIQLTRNNKRANACAKILLADIFVNRLVCRFSTKESLKIINPSTFKIMDLFSDDFKGILKRIIKLAERNIIIKYNLPLRDRVIGHNLIELSNIIILLLMNVIDHSLLNQIVKVFICVKDNKLVFSNNNSEIPINWELKKRNIHDSKSNTKGITLFILDKYIKENFNCNIQIDFKENNFIVGLPIK